MTHLNLLCGNKPTNSAVLLFCVNPQPEPVFEQRHGSFVVTLWRHWLTDQLLAEYNLNSRQLQAIDYLKSNERIANADYQKLSGVNRKTAARDLDGLVERGIIDRIGEKRGIHYVLRHRK
jgi:ATP-dependent DNA helicase RecG